MSEAEFIIEQYSESLGIDQSLCDALKASKAVISGSTLVHALQKRQGRHLDWLPRDVDIFVLKSEGNTDRQIWEWMTQNCESIKVDERHYNYKYSDVMLNTIKEVYTWKHKRTGVRFQIIKVFKQFDTIQVVVLNFDLSCCANSFDGVTLKVSSASEVKSRIAHINEMRLVNLGQLILSSHTISEALHDRIGEIQDEFVKRIGLYESRGFRFDNLIWARRVLVALDHTQSVGGPPSNLRMLVGMAENHGTSC